MALGPLRAPPSRADEAVPPGAAARSQRQRAHGSQHRSALRFTKDEFDAFLECGILVHGFLRLRCGECGHDKLLAFSCKRRGFCPSSAARRMAQTAAHLVDHVIPHVPVRQWVLSLPIPLLADSRAARVGHAGAAGSAARGHEASAGPRRAQARRKPGRRRHADSSGSGPPPGMYRCGADGAPRGCPPCESVRPAASARPRDGAAPGAPRRQGH